MIHMQKMKGKYSEHRTSRGNVQVGRLKGKSNTRIAKDMVSLTNLHDGRMAQHKWKASGRLALKREARKLE